MLGAIMVDASGLSAAQGVQLVRDLDLHGWFPSLVWDDDGSETYNEKVLQQWIASGTPFEIKFEAKFDPVVGDPEAVYWHAAPASRAAKIAARGLSPRAGAKLGNHPERVYLASTKVAAEKIARQFARKGTEKSYVIFRVDPRIRGSGQPIRLYTDPNWLHGVYTHDNIPPAALERGPTLDLLYSPGSPTPTP